jgi:hypothetical protein
LTNILEYKIFKLIKFIIVTALVSLLFACGGGGTTQSYQIIFDGTVSGLTSGQKVVLLASIPKTSQSVLITSSGGAFNSSITLPAPYTFSDAGVATVVVSSQPSNGNCTVSFLATTSIVVVCTPQKTAAGYYHGAIGPLADSRVIFLNDGTYWGFAGQNGNINLLIYGAAGVSTSGSYKSVGGISIGGTSTTQIALTGDYSKDGIFKGKYTENAAQYDVDLTSYDGIAYQFIKAPTLDQVTGTYAAKVGQ